MSLTLAVVLRISFSLFVTCAAVCLISAIYLYLFKLRRANEIMQHPYLTRAPYDRLPMSLRVGILLDYFLRVSFPDSRFWLAGHANQVLAHVNPRTVPSDVKWPLIGLWGGCLLGLPAMLVMWAIVLLVGVPTGAPG